MTRWRGSYIQYCGRRVSCARKKERNTKTVFPDDQILFRFELFDAISVIIGNAAPIFHFFIETIQAPVEPRFQSINLAVDFADFAIDFFIDLFKTRLPPSSLIFLTSF